MRLTDELLAEPRSCAVIPNRTTDPDGFIDTGRILPGWDQHIYVSVAAVKEMGRKVGMVPQEDVEAHVKRLQEMKAEITSLTEQVEALRKADEILEAVAA